MLIDTIHPLSLKQHTPNEHDLTLYRRGQAWSHEQWSGSKIRSGVMRNLGRVVRGLGEPLEGV